MFLSQESDIFFAKDIPGNEVAPGNETLALVPEPGDIPYWDLTSLLDPFYQISQLGMNQKESTQQVFPLTTARHDGLFNSRPNEVALRERFFPAALCVDIGMYLSFS